MPNEAHRLSEETASQAEALLRTGNSGPARELYFKAAEQESEALRQIDIAQPRSRGILAVSAASLFYKAFDLGRAETLAHSLLAENDLPDFAIEQLREILEVIWEDRALEASGRQYVGDTVMVSLRGTEIGAGRAPLGLVLDKIAGMNSLLYRITELLGDFPFRTRGAPSDVIKDLCQPWIGEAQTGSYRFAVRLVEPIQLKLLPTRTVTGREISQWLFRLVRSISPTAIDPALDAIEDLAPNRQYRHAILKLVRNMAPDGRRIKEIEFTTEREHTWERAVLHAGAKARIEDSLSADDPGGSNDKVEYVSGVLRAVHFDQNWLEVFQDSGQPLRCGITHEMLDDVVGPMLNRRVLVRGRWPRHRSGFDLIDIELDTDADTALPW